MIDLRFGRYQDVLADVACDLLLSDPPYGQRTHAGNGEQVGKTGRAELYYGAWTPDDVHAFVVRWAARTSGWMACMTCSDLAPVYREAYRDAGRQDFAPVPILQHRPRLSGDGPGSGAVYLMVARPKKRSFMSWGSLPCWYESQPAKDGIPGGKPLDLMRAIVRDYSRPGDTVVDPCAGGATTLIAAAIEGRKAVGSEQMLEHYEIAKKRIAKGWTPTLFADERPAAEQKEMF